MSLVSRWTQAFSRTSRDGMALSRALYDAVFPGTGANATSLGSLNSSPSETIKSVLLKEARKEPLPNSVAVSMLHFERELGLIKYWGLAEYLRQRRPLLSFSTRKPTPTEVGTADVSVGSAIGRPAAEGDGGDDASQKLSSSAGARVAFMITSSMKRELIDGLGYPEATVKGMTPQQASLVLHHRLLAESYDKKIPELEKKFAEDQERKLERARREASEDRTNTGTNLVSETSAIGGGDAVPNSSTSLTGKSCSSTISATDIPLLLSSSTSQITQESESSLSSKVPADISSTENDPFAAVPSHENNAYDSDLWYEVVEIRIKSGTSETTEIRHGLYKDHKEALLGLDTRQNIQRKREQEALNSSDDDDKKDIKFVLRPVSAKDLQ